jgi:hypothetical protein
MSWVTMMMVWPWVQLAQDAHHLFARAAVQRAGGLVGQDDAAAVHQRAGDGHPLLLAAGELARHMLGAVAQAQALQQGLRAAVAVRGRQAGVDRRHLHIALGRQVGQQVIALEDEAEVLAPQLGQFVRAEAAHSRPAMA